MQCGSFYTHFYKIQFDKFFSLTNFALSFRSVKYKAGARSLSLVKLKDWKLWGTASPALFDGNRIPKLMNSHVISNFFDAFHKAKCKK